MEIKKAFLRKGERKDVTLTEELKRYQDCSERIKKKLSWKMLKDLEEVFLYYKSFYIIDYVEFATIAVTCIERSVNPKTFFIM